VLSRVHPIIAHGKLFGEFGTNEGLIIRFTYRLKNYAGRAKKAVQKKNKSKLN
jgi:hypothetical protein